MQDFWLRLTQQPALLMRILLLLLEEADFPEELMAYRDAQTFSLAPLLTQRFQPLLGYYI